MKSMNLGENENEIESLSQILSKIQNLYYNYFISLGRLK
ncbi:hypothetical protein LCGC14_1265950 [marine sediment metagenome]|uniref:Uncharacterized protein n=1 Tax=marine sediment metagenome TaxID=412755 RepID=A0A0F9LKJ8_9ZZZZ